ncbi:kinase [Tamilnaduibacter salinus]|uniref:kinase n=1 Tax=Tamilnaduibacter salinus TaxID=1484056 RepID=UPI001B80BAB2|nr:kinase [Tamilnaduibacter salinus]
MASDTERRYSVRALLVTAFVAVVATVATLEVTGHIKHTRDKAKVPVGEFRAIYVGPREDYRMSPKSSELHAECYNGYLGVGSDTDATLKGVLVDYKNRGIRCAMTPREIRKEKQQASKPLPEEEGTDVTPE